VQGVSFRYETVRRATRSGVTGWVRNTSDGAVELEAQGHPDAVDALLQWAESGPPGARVERLVKTPRALEEGENEFKVLN
jgi:acylphosphatase